MVKLPIKCPECGAENYSYGTCPHCHGKEARLRARCVEYISVAQRKAITRTGSPVDDLMAFVQSERGRAADPSLEDTKPMILYFGCEQDRDEFMAIVREVKPGMVAKPIP